MFEAKILAALTQMTSSFPWLGLFIFFLHFLCLLKLHHFGCFIQFTKRAILNTEGIHHKVISSHPEHKGTEVYHKSQQSIAQDILLIQTACY